MLTTRLADMIEGQVYVRTFLGSDPANIDDKINDWVDCMEMEGEPVRIKSISTNLEAGTLVVVVLYTYLFEP